MGNNELFDDDGAPAGKALGDMLKANSTVKELDVSSSAEYSDSKGGTSFAKELAVGISANGALANLDLSENNIRKDKQRQIKELCKTKKIKLKL